MEETEFELLLEDIYNISKKYYKTFEEYHDVFIPDKNWHKVYNDIYFKFKEYSLEFHLEPDKDFSVRNIRTFIRKGDQVEYNKHLQYSKLTKNVVYVVDNKVQQIFGNYNELQLFIDSTVKEFVDEMKENYKIN